jgi:uncharacterized protein (TIGR02231 family)
MEFLAEAPIQAVTVYSEQAQVLRHAGVRATEAGIHTIRIGGLPQTLQRNSLRATGQGPSGTRILGIEQESEIHALAPSEQIQRLSLEITRLRREAESIDSRKNIIEEQRDWLRTLGEQTARRLANAIAAGTARPEDASALFAYTSTEAERLVRERLELETQAEERQKELEARTRELRELNTSAKPDRLAAIVRMEVPAPGDLDIELSYVIGGASWRPRYDARVDVESGRVQLVEQALVWQRTGEAWEAVSLSLSTARPNASVTLPDEPDPWYIDAESSTAAVGGSAGTTVMAAAPQRIMHSMRMRSERVPGTAAEEMSPGPLSGPLYDDYEAAQFAEAPAERSGAVQVFRLPGGIDIPSDGAPRTVGLGDHELPCRFEYVAAPIIAPGAHLRALASNNTGAVLLPGELHVFHAGPSNDQYVGVTQLERSAEGAEIKLYLGVDDNVTVKRELVERDTDKGTLLQSGIRRITFGYRVTLANRTSVPQRVILLDRLPVTRHERIKLRVLDLRPQPSARTRLEQLDWELQLAPGQEQRVEWRFLVEAPADLTLTGLQ